MRRLTEAPPRVVFTCRLTREQNTESGYVPFKHVRINLQALHDQNQLPEEGKLRGEVSSRPPLRSALSLPLALFSLYPRSLPLCLTLCLSRFFLRHLHLSSRSLSPSDAHPSPLKWNQSPAEKRNVHRE